MIAALSGVRRDREIVLSLPTGARTVPFGGPPAHGTRSDAEVEQRTRAYRSEVAECLALDVRAGEPTRVSLTVRVSPRGIVEAVRAESAIADDVARRLEDRALHCSLPGGEADATLELVFVVTRDR